MCMLFGQYWSFSIATAHLLYWAETPSQFSSGPSKMQFLPWPLLFLFLVYEQLYPFNTPIWASTQLWPYTGSRNWSTFTGKTCFETVFMGTICSGFYFGVNSTLNFAIRFKMCWCILSIYAIMKLQKSGKLIVVVVVQKLVVVFQNSKICNLMSLLYSRTLTTSEKSVPLIKLQSGITWFKTTEPRTKSSPNLPPEFKVA